MVDDTIKMLIQDVIREEFKNLNSLLEALASDVSATNNAIQVFENKFSYYDSRMDKLGEVQSKLIDFVLKESERNDRRFSKIEDKLEYLENRISQ